MKNYADNYHHLVSLQKRLKQEIPKSMEIVDGLNRVSMTDGVLSNKQKALMALSVAISKLCVETLVVYLHDAINAGATKAEILETIELCVGIGGRSVLIFASIAYEAMLQLEEDSDEFRDSFYA